MTDPGIYEYTTFHWFVQSGAYTWISENPLPGAVRTSQHSARRLQTSGDDESRRKPLRRYAPLEDNTGLFRLFADVDISEAGIFAFAERFGMLLSARTTLAPVNMPKTTVASRLSPHAEVFELWREEIIAMRQAVAIWELLEAGDQETLARHFRWRQVAMGRSEVDFDSHPDLPPDESPNAGDCRLVDRVAGSEDEDDWFARLKPDDPMLTARLWLAQLIQRRLEGRLEARFVLDAAGAMSLQVTPTCLLHALWYQFGRAVSEHKKYRRCLLCGDWFELSPDLARTNRRFCSMSCKNKAHRRRRDMAVQMRSDGKSVKEIAEELDTTPAVIKRWIALNKKE